MDGREPAASGRLPPDEVMWSLPIVYSHALALHAEGASEDEMSVILGVPPEVMEALLELARRKAARALAEMHRDGDRSKADPGSE